MSSKAINNSIYILVTGVTGVGKSTFIKQVTGNEHIKIGEGLDGCTQEVSEWETSVGAQRVVLVDTPGFDDGVMDDVVVLTKITQYVNGLHAFGRQIAGVLYLHDITSGRMRSGGLRNLEMMPDLVGRNNFVYCTLVTTHWGTLKDSSVEVRNEKDLKSEKYWKPLLEGPNPALYARFGNTAESCVRILLPHLNNRFTLQITQETVHQNLEYGQTTAGRTIRKNIDKHILAEQARDRTRIAQLQRQKRDTERAFQQKYDEERDKRYAQECERLRKERIGHRILRWSVVGTGLAASITCAILASGITGGVAAVPVGAALLGVAGPGVAGAFAWARQGSGRDKKRQDRLDEEYRKGKFTETKKESELDVEYDGSDDDDDDDDSTLYKVDIEI